MRSVLLCVCAALVVSACGKKGNPLPPLVRLPAAPADFAVARVDDQVIVRFNAPATNVDGAQPVDLGRIEVYALTLEGRPPEVAQVDPEELREAATLVATQPAETIAGEVIVREALTSEMHTPVVLPLRNPSRAERDTSTTHDGPLVAPPAGAGVQRYYVAFAVNLRNRYGPPTALVAAPLAPASGPPSAPRVTVTENSMSLRWTPPVDARGLGLATDPDWLPATPVVPPPPPTTYDVYETARNASSDRPARVPVPLNPEPIAATEFSQDGITLGAERCFYIRAVDIVDGVHVRGPASPMTCDPFADTFPPGAARDLVGVAVAGGVNLIWETSQSDDVVGYLVLRGEAGSATLTPLNKAAVTSPSYRDETVKPGVRYVYAIVAVDSAGNRSAESNRIEETAQ